MAILVVMHTRTPSQARSKLHLRRPNSFHQPTATGSWRCLATYQISGDAVYAILGSYLPLLSAMKYYVDVVA